MRKLFMVAVIGLGAALTFGCAEAKKLEGEAATAAKEVEKNPEAKKLEQKVEDKVEGKKDDGKAPAGGDKGAGGDSALEKSVTTAVGHGYKVSVKSGVVTLSGKAANAGDKTAAETAAKGVSGVSSVNNQLSVGK